jgi:hypothetical protein
MRWREHFGASQHALERDQHLLQRDVRLQPDDAQLDEFGRSRERVAVDAVQFFDIHRRALETLVLLQPAHQFRARVGFFLARRSRSWQQHARLDLGQRRGHDEVFAREFQLHAAHHVDVRHVLPRDLGDRDVEDVDVLPADQVEQQVERAFEGLEEHLQRIRRDVQVLRHLRDRLAIDHGERHLALLVRIRHVWFGLWLVPQPAFDQLEVGFRHASSCLSGRPGPLPA